MTYSWRNGESTYVTLWSATGASCGSATESAARVKMTLEPRLGFPRFLRCHVSHIFARNATKPTARVSWTARTSFPALFTLPRVSLVARARCVLPVFPRVRHSFLRPRGPHSLAFRSISTHQFAPPPPPTPSRCPSPPPHGGRTIYPTPSTPIHGYGSILTGVEWGQSPILHPKSFRVSLPFPQKWSKPQPCPHPSTCRLPRRGGVRPTLVTFPIFTTVRPNTSPRGWNSPAWKHQGPPSASGCQQHPLLSHSTCVIPHQPHSFLDARSRMHRSPGDENDEVGNEVNDFHLHLRSMPWKRFRWRFASDPS